MQIVWENGMQTTNSPGSTQGDDVVGMSCKAQQESGFFSFVPESFAEVL